MLQSLCSKSQYQYLAVCLQPSAAFRVNPTLKTRLERKTSTVDYAEVARFTAVADKWWSAGRFDNLRSMNSMKLHFIRNGILSATKRPAKEGSQLLAGLKIIDVGCGGGLLSEPLAEMGAHVTGIDPGKENIEAAIDHASRNGNLKGNLSYLCASVEDIAETGDQFDVLVCSDVLEYVPNVPVFIGYCAKITKEGGSLFFSCPSRTVLSYITCVLLTQYVLRVLPVGTLQYSYFIRPCELESLLRDNKCHLMSIKGLIYNYFTKSWFWSKSTDSFYILHAIKNNP